MLTTTYEIWDIINGEALIDQLTFEELAEQFLAYQNFYGEDVISACRRTTQYTNTHTTRSQEFKDAWIDYFGELQELGNL